MRGRRPVLGGVLLAVGVAIAPILGLATAAQAQDPVDLGGSHVVDRAQVLTSGAKTTAESATAKLYSDHKVGLFVVYVDRFTNPEDATDWANETAARNDLGPSDYLLAVATDGKAYYLSGDDNGPVSADQLDQIERNSIEPRLRTGDWSGAAAAAANGLGDAASGGGGGSGFFWFFVIGVVVVGLVVILLVRARGRRAVAPAGALQLHSAVEAADSREDVSAGAQHASAAEADDSEAPERRPKRKEEKHD